ncbi:MAG: hypothetical protein J6M66_02635 [Lachnospiraceae bacterium]|nr:hypothetical protein [Lachnospiraceae bacterium]
MADFRSRGWRAGRGIAEEGRCSFRQASRTWDRGRRKMQLQAGGPDAGFQKRLKRDKTGDGWTI